MPKMNKRLVIAREMIPLINYVGDFEAMKKEGIQEKLYPLVRNAQLLKEIPEKGIVFIIPPSITSMEIITSYQSFNDKDLFIIFSPVKTYECHLFIESNNLQAIWAVSNLNVDVIPFYKDLVSIEKDTLLYDTVICNNLDSMNILARAIVNFQDLFGKIKYTYCKGDLAIKLRDMVRKKEQIESIKPDQELLGCFYFDRTVDLITPFCTPYTYHGMIDTYFDIKFNTVAVDSKVTGVIDHRKIDKKENEKEKKQDEPKMVSLDLSHHDKFYDMIKDYHFNKIRYFLGERINAHNKVTAETKENNSDLNRLADSIKLMQKYNKERPSLNNHISLADYISKLQIDPYVKHYLRYEQQLMAGADLSEHLHDLYEGLMAKRVSMYTFLQLFVLESQTQCGIKPKYFDSLKKAFLNAYGYKEIFLWNNMEKLKIIQKKDKRKNYEDLIKTLNLINYKVDLMEPNDTAYVFGAFCPISIRLIERMIKGEWCKLKEFLDSNLIGGTYFPVDEREVSNPPKEKNFILLVFIGGITYGEIAAIRFLNSRMPRHKFIILTTSIINYKKIIDNIRECKETSMTMANFIEQMGK